MKYGFLAVLLLLIGTAFHGCTANLEDVKAAAPAKWRAQGFEVIDYEGYQFGMWFGGGYGGAHVWHRLRKIPDNGITYSGFIQKWGDEYHVYGPNAIDAIRPN